METGPSSYLYDSVRDVPVLTGEEEKELATKIQIRKHLIESLVLEKRKATDEEQIKIDVGKEAYDYLILANIKLGIWYAKRYAYKIDSSLTEDDLAQEANLGIMKAAEMFDPTMNNKFSTYAAFWIEQSIRRAIEDKGDLIRKPASAHTRLRQINKVTEGNSGIDSKEISDKTGIQESEVRFLRQSAAMRVISMDQSTDDDDDESEIPVHEAIASEHNVEEDCAEKLQRETFEDLITKITDQKIRTIVALRYGMNRDHMQCSHHRIACIMGLKESYVRRSIEDVERDWTSNQALLAKISGTDHKHYL